MSALRKVLEDVEAALVEEPPQSPAAVIDIVDRLGDRAALMRQLEQTWLADQEQIKLENAPHWQRLRRLEAVIQGAEPTSTLLGTLRRLTAEADRKAKVIRASHDAVGGIIEGLVQEVSNSERPEDWVRLALSYLLKPYALRHEEAVEQFYLLLDIQSQIDPDMQPSGDVLSPDQSLKDLFKARVGGNNS
ncbi:hypothetical protein GOFOIKOB_3009 [Methylobacterium tardum]|uniref:Uncharacterized protein n=1 Tax=Methylobacterium tardum TaxID=374432 RepID=A0AA37TBK3_9HYPH|nr:hypothetical protein [Methylobacterium tardum]URD38354.1 hypothetical protein M6G65_07890 [Methylobacterium tardum]GJE49968.1 hypothetical protein GOFOIKOB_3009 [Methylobacterium tardum]GLS70175.1 hypothetical protein GCM10007890_21880 [Methylobacterium tardum]